MSPVSSRDGRLHAAMAGRGNPYAVLTAGRLTLLRALHDDGTPRLAAEALGWTEQELAAELAPLMAAGLVEWRAGRYLPSFLIVAAGELRRVDAHARVVGRTLAARVRAGWDALETACAALHLNAQPVELSTFGFLLVGDRILDVGLLDALAAEGRLMPPAPARPAPGDPHARYYLWMIEGTRAGLGQYGQRATALPWPRWELLTFGRYAQSGAAARTAPREECEGAALAHAREHPDAGPAGLAAALSIALFDRVATTAWTSVARAVAGELLGVYVSAEPELRELWLSLRSAARLPHGFGEFLCWYDHLAYAHAINDLVAAGAFSLPAAGFSAALWQEPGAAGAF